ncbi:HAMP domain-containing histidine kinase [Panacibacter ginsenosidivorans]|uniref:histidine kinase n=1 Tax=Panacibacter ginsenosidivorans TaxID=1813871 RepID=A0A5B8VF74_9BACT|nr:HAMP domain-containing sensor histidine kinase [Panacibacter ginsenosidivorans]QEC69745.1 HAMP domain-containing histidine kinase [Panacibacter ginsenosidivorans]
MPVRIKITLFFTLIVFVILSLLCSAVYYFSYINRQKNFNNRLTNRAVTTARLLAQSETFNQELIHKIDASTALAMTNKTVQAYDFYDKRIYAYADKPGDTISVDKKILEEAKQNQYVYFTANNKDAAGYHFTDKNNHVIIIIAAYDAEGKKNLQQLQYILWSCFVGGILIALAGGYFFTSGLLRPVRKIADELNDISAQNLTRRIVSRNSKDEWDYLTNTLNELLDRLEESFDTQRRFIANASHELSTPLTSVSSQLEVSLQKERNANDYKTVMHSVLQDVRHLNKLTQALLQFAKASGTSSGLEIDLVRIDEILLRMPRDMIKLNNEYIVKLSFNDLPEEEEKLLIFGNEDLLFSAIKNIVLNACKYSSNHTANINLSVKQYEIIIEVIDEGRGIAKDELQNIFQPFFRAGDHKTETGFGLGLSLTSRIIKLHRGHIKVDSVINTGTTFTIYLPVAGTK